MDHASVRLTPPDEPDIVTIKEEKPKTPDVIILPRKDNCDMRATLTVSKAMLDKVIEAKATRALDKL